MSTIGRKLISSFVYSGDIAGYVLQGMHKELFKEGELALYEFVNGHLKAYGALPNPDTVQEKLGDVLVLSPEPPEYYMAEAEKRFMQGQLKTLAIQTQDYLTAQDPMKAFELIMTRVADLNTVKHRNSIIDFRDIAEKIWQAYQVKKNGVNNASMFFGWDTLDSSTGGLGAGDVCSVVGRPAAGKTFLELFMAEHNWKQGHKPMVVSMEMTLIAIGQRIAAMSAHTSLTHLLKGKLTYKGMQKFKEAFATVKQAATPFWLVDGNLTATVDSVIMMARQMKPSCLFIDGAYLLRHPSPKASRFEKMTENAEWIKQRIATDLGIPVVCSYQFSRDVKKKKKNEAVGLEDIYGSDAIGQLSSVVLGLLEDESIETEKRRRVNILKGRNGETGEFIINWDFFGMNFNEIKSIKDADGKVKESTADMQFLG